MEQIPMISVMAGLIREALVEDPQAALKDLAAQGLSGLEGGEGVVKIPLLEYRQLLDEYGLASVGIAVRHHALEEDMPEAIAKARVSGARYILIYWASMENEEQIKTDAERFNKAGALAASEGLTFCYHNHDHEFTTFIKGRRAIDCLLAQTDPQYVSLQLDIAWAWMGGADPAGFLQAYPDRIRLLHLKDMWTRQRRDSFTALGSGCVDVQASLVAARTNGIEFASIEQDKPRRLAGGDSLNYAILHLRETGWL